MQQKKKNSIVKRVYDRTRRHFSNPTLVCSIENTTSCNLKCQFCPHSNLNLKVEFISTQMWDLAITQITELYTNSNYKMLRISYGGLGEPLLHPKFLEHLQNLKKRLPDAKIQLDTNGVLLDSGKADAIIENKLVDTLSISLNAPTKELYNALMLSDKFDLVLKNLQCFVAKRNSLNSKIKVSVCVKDTDACRNDNIVIKSLLDTILSDQDSFYINDILNWGGKIDVDSFKSESELKPIDFPCYGIIMISNVVIDLHGNVYPCCCSMGDERENSYLVLGNIQNKPLKDIWNNDKHKKLKKSMMRGEFSNIVPCKNCTMYSDDMYNLFFTNPFPIGPKFF